MNCAFRFQARLRPHFCQFFRQNHSFICSRLASLRASFFLLRTWLLTLALNAAEPAAQHQNQAGSHEERAGKEGVTRHQRIQRKRASQEEEEKFTNGGLGKE